MIQSLLAYLFLIALISPIVFFIWTQLVVGVASAFVFTGKAIQPAPKDYRVVSMRVRDYDYDED